MLFHISPAGGDRGLCSFAQITIALNPKVLIIDIQHSPVVLMLDNLIVMLFSADLSNCKLISFPDGVFKVLRSVLENIRVITLADNEMKALSSKFFSTFTQLRGSGRKCTAAI